MRTKAYEVREYEAGYLEGLRMALEAARHVRLTSSFGSEAVEDEIEEMIAEAEGEEDMR